MDGYLQLILQKYRLNWLFIFISFYFLFFFDSGPLLFIKSAIPPFLYNRKSLFSYNFGSS